MNYNCELLSLPTRRSSILQAMPICDVLTRRGQSQLFAEWSVVVLQLVAAGAQRGPHAVRLDRPGSSLLAGGARGSIIDGGQRRQEARRAQLERVEVVAERGGTNVQ